MLSLDVAQTFAVNSITEISTYCTSIVARTEDGLITHVRNLDFKPVDKMKHLIYEQVMVKDGKQIAIAPGMAPFTGIFTGHKPGSFLISYNVREKLPEGPARDHEIMQNLSRMLDSGYYL